MGTPPVSTDQGKALRICQSSALQKADSSSVWEMYVYYSYLKQNTNSAIILYLPTMGMDSEWVSQVIFIWFKVFNGKLPLGSFLVQQNIQPNHQLTPKPSTQKTHHSPSWNQESLWQMKQIPFAVAQDLTASLMVHIYLRTLKHVIYKLLLSHSGLLGMCIICSRNWNSSFIYVSLKRLADGEKPSEKWP